MKGENIEISIFFSIFSTNQILKSEFYWKECMSMKNTKTLLFDKTGGIVYELDTSIK